MSSEFFPDGSTFISSIFFAFATIAFKIGVFLHDLKMLKFKRELITSNSNSNITFRYLLSDRTKAKELRLIEKLESVLSRPNFLANIKRF